MNQVRPCTTIFTDASRNTRIGDASWGCKILFEGKGYSGSGKLGHTSHIIQAELMSILKGLEFAEKRDLLPERAIVAIQNDSLQALGILLADNLNYRAAKPKHEGDQLVVPRKWRRDCESTLRTIERLHNHRRLVIMLRHVKGHKKHRSHRHRINHEVDKLAKDARGI